MSGTLADGTPFAFSSNEGDTIAAGSITLQAADVANGPAIINVPAVAAPSGVHYGQTLNLSDGGTLNDDFNAGWGGTVNVGGGQIGSNFEAAGATVTVFAGSIGAEFDAFNGTTVNILGGSLGTGAIAYAGSVVNISGGSVAGFQAAGQSATNIAGGFVDKEFEAASGSTVRITGGIINDAFDAKSGSVVRVLGGDFRLNGTPIEGLEAVGSSKIVNMNQAGDTLTGTLADGTPCSFSLQDGDLFGTSVLSLETVAVPPVSGPALITVPTASSRNQSGKVKRWSSRPVVKFR